MNKEKTRIYFQDNSYVELGETYRDEFLERYKLKKRKQKQNDEDSESANN